VVDQDEGSEAPARPVYLHVDDEPLRHSRLVQMARRATRIAEQARGVDHGAVLLGVAGTVQLWGEVRLEEPDLIAYLIADACDSSSADGHRSPRWRTGSSTRPCAHAGTGTVISPRADTL